MGRGRGLGGCKSGGAARCGRSRGLSAESSRSSVPSRRCGCRRRSPLGSRQSSTANCTPRSTACGGGPSSASACSWSPTTSPATPGPLVSPDYALEALMPCYRRLAEEARKHGLLPTFHSDGDIRTLVPALARCRLRRHPRRGALRREALGVRCGRVGERHGGDRRAARPSLLSRAREPRPRGGRACRAGGDAHRR